MSLFPLKIRNVMVRRMGLPEEPVDEFVEALGEMSEDYMPRAEADSKFDLLRAEMRALVYQATFVIVTTMLAIGGIIIGLLVAG